jgi:hypothetical protein
VKIIAVILALFVISLSMVPCCPPESEKIVAKHSFSEDEHNHDVNSESNHCDDNCKACSPFFTCGSCVGVTFQLGSINLLDQEPFSKDLDFPLSVSFLSFYFNKLWQPPKIMSVC